MKKYCRIGSIREGDFLPDGYKINESYYIKPGFPLSQSNINWLEKQLRNEGKGGIYVESDINSSITIDVAPLLSDEIKDRAKKELQKIDVESTVDTAKKIASEIYSLKNISLDFIEDRSPGARGILEQSIAVAEIATVIGKALNFSLKQLEDLSSAALVHKVGMLMLDPSSYRSMGFGPKLELNPDTAKNIAKEYPIHSLNIINKVMGDRFPATAKHGVAFHLINEDGSGYNPFPSKAAVSMIHPYAKIIHIAVEYDKAKYESGVCNPSLAYERIYYGKGTLFVSEYVDKFLEYAPLFPLGTTVYISNRVGQDMQPIEAVVVKHNSGFPTRPQVMIKKATGEFEMMDLNDMNNLSYMIVSDAIGNIFSSDRVEITMEQTDSNKTR